MDYGKYKLNRKKVKEARKKLSKTEVKEVKMRYKIDKHDKDKNWSSCQIFKNQR